MSQIAKGIVAEFQYESANTRKMLERIPEDKFDWQPHDKSMTLGRLATHLAEMPEWCGTILDQDELDLAGSDYEPKTAGSVADLLELFDTNAAAFADRVSGCTDEEMLAGWTLRAGENVFGTQPKVGALRAFILSHAVHHRGQLSVYLRLLDVSLPQVYGPTADDAGGFG
ncbi:MAG: DinB family protein [Deltaproteobacteria bacterium]|nr:DinB family protein [Deltaproteobacteria bacterium]